MYELSTKRQQQINGGSVMYRIIYALLGIAGMKLLRASLSHLRGGRVIRMKQFICLIYNILERSKCETKINQNV